MNTEELAKTLSQPTVERSARKRYTDVNIAVPLVRLDPDRFVRRAGWTEVERAYSPETVNVKEWCRTQPD